MQNSTTVHYSKPSQSITMPAKITTAPSRPSETLRMAASAAQNTYASSMNTTTNHRAVVVSKETMCEGIDNVFYAYRPKPHYVNK